MLLVLLESIASNLYSNLLVELGIRHILFPMKKIWKNQSDAEHTDMVQTD